MAERHIANVARTLMGKLRVTWEDALVDFTEDSPVTAWALFRKISDSVREEVDKMRFETMGRIVAQARRTEHEIGTLENQTSLKQAMGEITFPEFWSGDEILAVLATGAIIAEMFDQLRVR